MGFRCLVQHCHCFGTSMRADGVRSLSSDDIQLHPRMPEEAVTSGPLWSTTWYTVLQYPGS